MIVITIGLNREPDKKKIFLGNQRENKQEILKFVLPERLANYYKYVFAFNGSQLATKYQRAHLWYNGLYWDAKLCAMSINEEGYYSQLSNANSYAPYATKLGVPKCTYIQILTGSPYTVVSGTLKIYAR